MEKARRKFVRKITLLLVVLVLLAALLIFVLVWFFGASYPAFFENAQKEGKIPGLKEGISPQGLCALPENGAGYTFAMSGYMVDGSASRVYFLGRGEEKYFTLKDSAGKAVTTHFGGITSDGENLWIASKQELLQVPLTAAYSTENGGAVSVSGELNTGINNAFCYYANGNLYAGEFYRAGNYETPQSHRLTENGETNYAFVYEYPLAAIKGNGEAETPAKVLSVRGLVQGIAIYENHITLSTSYGLADSVFYTYENVLSGEPQGTVSLNGVSVPLYRLDKTNLKGTLTAPCMSEEIFVKDGRMYILFESLCDKYKYFVRKQIGDIYSLPLADFTA